MGKIALLVSREEMIHLTHNILQERKYEIGEMRVIQTEDAVLEARRSIANGASIIIARGLQASLIKQYTNIPVVEIVLTAQEMALLVVRAKQIVDKEVPVIAVVGFKNMFCDMSYFDAIYNIELRAYYAAGGAELERVAMRAVEDKADLLIGGDTAVRTATREGVPSLFLSITEDSLRNAFSMAENLDYAMGMEKRNAAQMETLLDYSFNGVVRMDQEGSIIAVNPIMEELMGKTEREALGRHIFDVFPDITEEILRDILKKGAESLSLFMQAGKTQVFAILAPVLIDGRVDGAILTCHKVKKHRQIERNEDAGRKGLIALGDFRDILQESRVMRECVHRARLYSMSDRPVLITGEAGTEKRLLAQCIHNNGLRSDGPFLGVHCDGLSGEAQMEAVFGERGAAAMAAGGTLLLEEVDRLDLANQHRLCQLIRYKVRVGKDVCQPVKTDVRVIAVTDSDLGALCGVGEFHRELLYLLTGLNVTIPPLRMRREDLERRLEESMKEVCGRYSRYHVLTDGARKQLLAYPWPGNLLQVEGFFERLILTAGKRSIDEVTVGRLLRELYPDAGPGAVGPAIGGKLPVEAQAIVDALYKYGGRREPAARELGISKATLWRHMKKYGIDDRSWG